MLRSCARFSLVPQGLSLVLALAVVVPAVAAAAQQTRQVPVESLIYDLKNPDPVRRREAATLIGQNKIQRATPDLLPLATDLDPSVRRAVVGALLQIQDGRAIPGFVTMSADAERDIRERAIEGMTSAYLPSESGLVVTLNRVATFFNPWSDEWADVVIEPDLAPAPAVIEALVARLQDDDEGIRAKAARSVGILRGRPATRSLVSLTRGDRSNAVRFESVRALRKIGDPSVGADLVALLTYTDTKVRDEAIYTLGRLRYQPAVPELTRLYEQEAALPIRQSDRALRERLLGALAFIGDPQSKGLFLRERQVDDADIVLHSYEGLARIADPDTLTDISKARIAEKSPKILTAQAWALYRLGRREYLDGVVMALSTRRTNSEARQYLLELRQDEVPELFQYARHRDSNVREAVAELLGLIGDERAAPVLRDMTRDSSKQVAALASQALHRLNARSSS